MLVLIFKVRAAAVFALGEFIAFDMDIVAQNTTVNISIGTKLVAMNKKESNSMVRAQIVCALQTFVMWMEEKIVDHAISYLGADLLSKIFLI